MPLPKITTPAHGSVHRHGVTNQRTFYWDPGSPPVVPTHWRVKVGATPGSGNYYPGNLNPIPKVAEQPTHSQTFSFTTNPPTGKLCYTTVEWSTDGGATFPYQGDITNFTCNP